MLRSSIVATGTLLLALAAGGAQAQTYSTTRSQIPSTSNFPSSLNSFVASGYAANGDAGAGCAYVRNTQGGGPGSVQDGQGMWWQLATDKPVSVTCFGAKGNGTDDDTTAINNAIGAVTEIHFPCGNFLATTINIAGGSQQNQKHLQGAGFCSKVTQSTAAAGAPLVRIGSGFVNDTGGVLVSDLAFDVNGQKSGGALIFAKGSSKLRLENLYAVHPTSSANPTPWFFNGVELDGVDYVHVSNVQLGFFQADGVRAYDGFDCNNFKPTAQTVSSYAIYNAGTANAYTVLTMNNVSGIVVGDHAYLSTIPNTSGWGAVTAISGNNVTVSGVNSVAPANGWYVTFGYSCSGTNLTFDRDTTITNASGNGVAIDGGIGGVNLNSVHIYTSGNGLYTSQDLSAGQSNREFFLNAGADIDSNVGYGVYVKNASLTRLNGTGAWVVASGSGNVYIAPQLPNSFPAEHGAIVQFSGGSLAASGAGYGLHWEDTGSLQLDGVGLSYNKTDGVQLASNSATGDVLITDNNLRSNGGYGVNVSGTLPSNLSFVGNNWGNNTSGPHPGAIAGNNSVCQANRGGTGGC